MKSEQDPKSIFDAALDIESQADREAYLSAACDGNPQLRSEVNRLLDEHQDVGSLLECVSLQNATLTHSSEGGGNDSNTEPTDTETPGATVSQYLLKEKLGEGGVGVVFSAVQLTPVRRPVALKLIKPGMDSREVISRFNIERQALAMMDHPSIVIILDAGQTPAGRPYFAMELVDGMPITDYCDLHRLSIRDRLHLFVQVCNAVQHAHQRGVIHRDLKPGNILVESNENQAIPKIIDFGIAKALDNRLSIHTTNTRVDQLIGTPLYMSPEQAASKHDEIDARSDIYSLGVLLFELLTGSAPVTRRAMGESGFQDILSQIQQSETPKPSSRLTASNEHLDDVAKKRRAHPSKLEGFVRGDLDWIVAKSLERERERRYDSASALGRDIERFLSNDPIEARPPTARYKLGKFLKKNRVVVSVTSLFAIVLLTSTIVSVGAASNANHAAGIARQKEKNADTALLAEKVAKNKEAAQRKQAEDVLNFILRALNAPDTNIHGTPVSMDSILSQAVSSLENQPIRTPQTKAAILSAIGQLYTSFGSTKKALPFNERAFEIWKEQLGHSHPKTLDSMQVVATTLEHALKRDEATDIYLQAIKIIEDSADNRQLDSGLDPQALIELKYVELLVYQKNRDEQKNYLTKLIEKWKKRYGEYNLTTMHAKIGLCRLYSRKRQFEIAESHLAKIIDDLKQKRFAYDRALFGKIRMAGYYILIGRSPDKLIGHMQTLAAIESEALGEHHPAVLSNSVYIASLHSRAGTFESVKESLQPAFDYLNQNKSHLNPHMIASFNELAYFLILDRNFEHARNVLIRTLDASQTALGTEHFQTNVALQNLSYVYLKTNELKKARDLLIFKRTHSPKRYSHANTHSVVAQYNLAVSYQHERESSKMSYLERSCNLTRVNIGTTKLTNRIFGRQIHELFQSQKYFDAWLKLEQFCKEQATRYKLGRDDVLDVQFLRLRSLMRLNRIGEAHELYCELLSHCHQKTTHRQFPKTYLLDVVFADELIRQRRYVEAKTLLDETLNNGVQTHPEHWLNDIARCLLGITLHEISQNDSRESRQSDSRQQAKSVLQSSIPRIRKPNEQFFNNYIYKRSTKALSQILEAEGQNEQANKWRELSNAKVDMNPMLPFGPFVANGNVDKSFIGMDDSFYGEEE